MDFVICTYIKGLNWDFGFVIFASFLLPLNKSPLKLLHTFGLGGKKSILESTILPQR